MSITRRERDGWQYADIVLDGRRKVVALGTKDVRVAEKIISVMKAEMVLGRFNLNNLVPKVITLEDFTKLYLDYAASYKRSTTIHNEQHCLRIFSDFVGPHLSLRHVGAQLLDRWKAAMLTAYSPTTYNIMWRTLHASFNVAVRWGYIDINPFGKISKVKVEQMRRYLTLGELQKIIEIHDQDMANPRKHHRYAFNAKFRLLVEFLLLTGLRRQEVLSLTIDRVDMQGDVIFIERTKSKTFRTIPMHPRVRGIIEQLGESLFLDMKPSSVSHRFARLVVRAGLSKDFKLHSLRHTFATNLVSKGVDISVIQNLLGHADIRTTLVYGKTTVETMKKDIRKLDSLR